MAGTIITSKFKTYLLRLAVVTWSDLLPCRTTTLKVPEGLRQLKRLDHNALLLLVESELGVAGQREVLPQRVSVEAVVGHDAPQIGVTDEEDTEHVVDLTLVPVGTVVEACDGGYGRSLAQSNIARAPRKMRVGAKASFNRTSRADHDEDSGAQVTSVPLSPLRHRYGKSRPTSSP